MDKVRARKRKRGRKVRVPNPAATTLYLSKDERDYLKLRGTVAGQTNIVRGARIVIAESKRYAKLVNLLETRRADMPQSLIDAISNIVLS